MTAVIVESGTTIIPDSSITQYILVPEAAYVVPETSSVQSVLVSQPDPTIILAGQAGPAGKDADPKPKNPSYTYNPDGTLNRIDYANGNYKLLTWVSGVLTTIVFVAGTSTTTKQYLYNPDGTLSEIVET